MHTERYVTHLTRITKWLHYLIPHGIYFVGTKNTLNGIRTSSRNCHHGSLNHYDTHTGVLTSIPYVGMHNNLLRGTRVSCTVQMKQVKRIVNESEKYFTRYVNSRFILYNFITSKVIVDNHSTINYLREQLRSLDKLMSTL